MNNTDLANFDNLSKILFLYPHIKLETLKTNKFRPKLLEDIKMNKRSIIIEVHSNTVKTIINKLMNVADQYNLLRMFSIIE